MRDIVIQFLSAENAIGVQLATRNRAINVSNSLNTNNQTSKKEDNYEGVSLHEQTYCCKVQFQRHMYTFFLNDLQSFEET